MATINGNTLFSSAGTVASFSNKNKQLAVLCTILAQCNAGNALPSSSTQETILSTETGLDQFSSQQLLGIVINQLLIFLSNFGTSSGSFVVAYFGNGNPNGTVTSATVPAIYFQLDAGNTIWSKTTGAGTNTGWK